eukprot:SAG11_NODE_32472_length_283_cov_0.842391_1_plen_21_part_10
MLVGTKLGDAEPECRGWMLEP